MSYTLPAMSMKAGVAMTEPVMQNFLYLLAILNSGVSAIKSVQSVSITLTSVTSNTATITAVDTTKSVLLWQGVTTSGTSGDSDTHVRIALTNGTTVTASRVGNNGTATVNCRVLEFN